MPSTLWREEGQGVFLTNIMLWVGVGRQENGVKDSTLCFGRLLEMRVLKPRVVRRGPTKSLFT